MPNLPAPIRPTVTGRPAAFRSSSRAWRFTANPRDQIVGWVEFFTRPNNRQHDVAETCWVSHSGARSRNLRNVTGTSRVSRRSRSHNRCRSAPARRAGAAPDISAPTGYRGSCRSGSPCRGTPLSAAARQSGAPFCAGTQCSRPVTTRAPGNPTNPLVASLAASRASLPSLSKFSCAPCMSDLNLAAPCSSKRPKASMKPGWKLGPGAAAAGGAGSLAGGACGARLRLHWLHVLGKRRDHQQQRAQARAGGRKHARHGRETAATSMSPIPGHGRSHSTPRRRHPESPARSGRKLRSARGKIEERRNLRTRRHGRGLAGAAGEQRAQLKDRERSLNAT